MLEKYGNTLGRKKLYIKERREKTQDGSKKKGEVDKGKESAGSG